MISFICPACKSKLSFKDESCGKRGNCPHCQKTVLVPSADPVAPGPPTAAYPPGSSPVSLADAVTVNPPGDTPSSSNGSEAKLDFLAPAQSPDELGRLGPYRVLKILGTGGMGMVLLADDPVLKRSVAIKVMLPEVAKDKTARQRFLREARSTAAIDHPHIVHIFQVGEENDVPFIVMPLLKGEPLDARLKREKRLPIGDAIHIAKQIAEGLAVAHQHGLIHRDIKPANIFLVSGGLVSGVVNHSQLTTVKIVDFGLARGGEDVHLTRTGAILGTPAYMAPEQARTEKVNFRCDLFSLGAVTYRMLTGELPFKGHDQLSMLMAVSTDTPKPVPKLNPEVPPPLADLVMQLLEKDPAKRPASANAVADKLSEIAGEQNVALANPPPGSLKKALWFLRPWKFRRPWLTLGIQTVGGLLFLLLTLLLIAKSKRDSTSRDAVSTSRGCEGAEKEFTNSTGMKFVLVPKGKFLMGGGGGRVGWKDLDIPHNFYLGRYEVTQGEWQAVMGVNPSYFAPSGGGWDRVAKFTAEELKNFPVEWVSWFDTQEFIHRLNQREKSAGWAYRLPTEAEWEYACRGGGGRPIGEYAFDFYFEKPTNRLLSEMANFNFGDKALKRPCKVGSYQPNRLGLNDMHGNVWEWCQDEVKGDRGAQQRVHRGGAYDCPSENCRAMIRFFGHPSLQSGNLGFRVARVPANAGPPNELVNSLKMKFRLIPAGKFTMGSSQAEIDRVLKVVGINEGKDHIPAEGPEHEVEITKAFYLGETEVTVGQYRQFIAANPNYQTGDGWQKPGFEQTDKHPVVNVSWNDAVAFCAWLSRKEDKNYRLPTEAEWEYSCRAGTKTCYSFGDSEERAFSYAWINTNAGGRTHSVRELQPNDWGLYDMHGNAWEWCHDRYDGNYYKNSPKKDPPGGAFADGGRVVRGGSWSLGPVCCRSAFRDGGFDPSDRAHYVGFRVLLVPSLPGGVRP